MKTLSETKFKILPMPKGGIYSMKKLILLLCSLILAAAPVFGAGVTDTFVRANETQLRANGWNIIETAGFLQLLNHTVTIIPLVPSASAYGFVAYTGSNFANDQEATITLGSSCCAGGSEGVIVRASNSQSINDGYLAIAEGPIYPTGVGGKTYIALMRIVQGGTQGLANSFLFVHIGDKLQLQATGSVLKVFLNGTLVVSANDTMWTKGFPGVYGAGANTDSSTIVNFEASPIVP